MDLIATEFLTGSILSIVVPLGLLAVVGTWWVVIVRRGDRGDN
jgi:hypothetical protein